MPEMQDLIAIFKAETEDHLTKLDSGLVELEKQPGNIELLRSLNREVHTLKGSARVFGFTEIQDIAHRIEDIFEEVAGKRAVFSSLVAERIFKGLDAIRAILDGIMQEKGVDIDASEICRMLEDCLSPTQGIPTQRKREKVSKRQKEVFEIREKNGQVKEQKEGKTQSGGKIQDEGAKTQDQNVGRVSETAAPHPTTPIEEYIRVPLSRVDKLLYLVGEVVANRMKTSIMVTQAKRLSKLSKEVQKSVSSLNEAIKKEFSSQDGEVVKWLSQCDAQVLKLREHTLKLYDHVTTEAYHLDPIIDELQAKMRNIKMVPLSTIFEGFPAW